MSTGCEQISFFSNEQKQSERRTVLRLRERFLSEHSLEHFDDTEVLSTVLSYASGTKDTTGLVARLLENFGSLKAVLEARPEQLLKVDGMNRTRASLISLMVPMARVWQRCANEIPDRIGNCREAEDYCKSLLIGERVEKFYVIALSTQCRILGKRLISTGSLSEVNCYPRSCVEFALSANAASVLVCHNHPGNTCAPSPEDISSTVQLQRLFNGLGITLIDHIIVAGDRTYSMIKNADIDYRVRNL